MLLAVSVGNSHITFGVHGESGWVRRFRIQTVREKTPDEYMIVFRELFAQGGIAKESLDSAILSSVVPPLTTAIAETVLAVSGANPLLLTHSADLGLRITTENPAEVGADLVANAVAAYDKFHANCIVVDFGTALTFTAVAAPARAAYAGPVPSGAAPDGGASRRGNIPRPYLRRGRPGPKHLTAASRAPGCASADCRAETPSTPSSPASFSAT